MNIIMGVTEEGRRRAWIERGEALGGFVNLTVPSDLSADERGLLWDLLNTLKFRSVPGGPMTRYLPGLEVEEVPADLDNWKRFIAGLAAFAKEREELAKGVAKSFDVHETPSRWQRVKSALFGHE